MFTASEEVPDPITEAGLKLAPAPAGNPLMFRVTPLLKPPDGVTVTVKEAALFCLVTTVPGEAEMEKSPAAGALMINVTDVVRTRVPSVPVMVKG